MDKIIANLEAEFHIKLDDTQHSVLSNLILFCKDSSDEKQICLVAGAGKGKSLLIKMLVSYLRSIGEHPQCLTPTNKSKSIYDDPRVLTIHSFLNLRPNIDIMDYDARQLSFDFGFCKIAGDYSKILIIDEASMVNDDLVNELAKHCDKAIYVGDSCQLSPVKQTKITKAFNCRQLTLDKVYRQKESKLSKVLNYLRVKPLYEFKSVEDENCSIKVYHNINQMLNETKHLFKFASDTNDKNLVKLVSFTNNRISALNDYIRKLIYNDDEEYHIGEVVTAYDSFNNEFFNLENSADYVITKISPCNIHGMKAWDIELDNWMDIKILSKYNSESMFKAYAVTLEDLRQKAINSKNKKDWRKYFKMNDSVLTPIDLIYDNRVIKRKSLDYGYCITAHKSQSSEYQIVIVDMENIFRCNNPKELRQLQYVACSRTKSDLIIYQKNDTRK